jgi:hypothetical protein
MKLPALCHIRMRDYSTGYKGRLVETCPSWEVGQKRIKELQAENPDAHFYFAKALSTREKARRANAARNQRTEGRKTRKHSS